jgi:hypothetical protein
MFTEDEINIIKALIEAEIGLVSNVSEPSYTELFNMYRETLMAMLDKLAMMQAHSYYQLIAN